MDLKEEIAVTKGQAVIMIELATVRFGRIGFRLRGRDRHGLETFALDQIVEFAALARREDEIGRNDPFLAAAHHVRQRLRIGIELDVREGGGNGHPSGEVGEREVVPAFMDADAIDLVHRHNGHGCKDQFDHALHVLFLSQRKDQIVVELAGIEYFGIDALGGGRVATEHVRWAVDDLALAIGLFHDLRETVLCARTRMPSRKVEDQRILSEFRVTATEFEEGLHVVILRVGVGGINNSCPFRSVESMAGCHDQILRAETSEINGWVFLYTEHDFVAAQTPT